VVAGRAIGRALALAGSLALALPAFANAAPAELDRTFGNQGSVVVDGPSGARLPTQAPAKMAVGPNGEILVLYVPAASCSGGFQSCTIDWSIARFSPDGVRDAQFNPTFPVRGNEYSEAALAVGPDGKPVIAAVDSNRVVVARFDQTGALETTFGSEDAHPLESVAYSPPVVAVQADGKVVVAAEGPLDEGGSDLRVVRYLPSGPRDPGFGNAGEAVLRLGTRSRPSGILYGSDGSLSFASPPCCGGSGAFFGEGFSLARLLPSGAPDPSLAGDGTLLFPTPGVWGRVEALAAAPGGGAFVSFAEETEAVTTVGNVVKFRADGSLDPAFGGDGRSKLLIGGVNSLSVDAQGRLVAGGWSGGAAVARLRPDGHPDMTFAGGQFLPLKSSGPAFAALQGSKLVALAEPCCGAKELTLYRLTAGTDHTRCLGHKATIVGTQGRDELTGTPHRDVIAALSGADTVRGLGGPDLICGGKGRDKLYGGAGKNQVQADPAPVKSHRRVR